MANFQDLNSSEFDDEFAAVRSIYSESYDDESYMDPDSEDFLGDLAKGVSGVITGGINAAANTGRRIASGVGTILGVNPVPASTSGISSSSNLSGTIQSPSGQRVPFNLPSSIATKQDVEVLRKAIAKINTEIKAVADANNVNAKAVAKLTSEVQGVENRRLQNQKSSSVAINKLGAALEKARKELRKMKDQNQMQMMMSLFMQPSYQVVLNKSNVDSANNGNEVTLEVKSSGDDNMFLMMAMMGGFGGSSGDGDSNGFNPMMMYLLAENN